MAKKPTKKTARAKASRAAKKGWVTRRANELAKKRAAAARKRTRRAIKPKRKKQRTPKRDQIMYLVTLKFKTRQRRGEPPTTFKRDLLIPAPPGATLRDLKRIARDTLPEQALPLLDHMTKKNTTIAEGGKTRARKATDR